MHKKLKLKDGLALVGSEGKGKPGAEDPLRKKSGEEQYGARDFGEALKSWEGSEDGLNKKAFGFHRRRDLRNEHRLLRR